MSGDNWPAREIITKSVDSLIPYANNARIHSEDQIDQLAASIQEWGWTVPILIDEGGGIIAGHGRVMAAQLLGIQEVPAMIASGWTDEQKRAYVIADNKLALNASWDDDALLSEIRSLQADGFDLEKIGFDESELDLLMFDASFEPGSEDDQGKLDELAPKMVCCPECGHGFDSRGHEQS